MSSLKLPRILLFDIGGVCVSEPPLEEIFLSIKRGSWICTNNGGKPVYARSLSWMFSAQFWFFFISADRVECHWPVVSCL